VSRFAATSATTSTTSGSKRVPAPSRSSSSRASHADERDRDQLDREPDGVGGGRSGAGQHGIRERAREEGREGAVQES
jgi:hypothetical protein